MELRKYKLSDFLESFGDGIHGTPEYNASGDYFFVNGNNLKNGKVVITNDTKRITENEYLKIRRRIGDTTLLVSINGTLGNIAEYNNEKIALGKSACFLNLKDKKERSFIKYALSTNEFNKYMNLVAGKSTIKNVSPSQISEYTFNTPISSNARSNIANTLSTIDEKIELNRAINQNLPSLDHSSKVAAIRLVA